ncbi:sigma-70 family RNA polymerase sigma factor [Sorangium sp. So ce260]|uniref:RNA polymerase sigma factor n=1 Tax=Sorangium sp. So ce260 TaxID=3133291 RepID=UPI003F648A28
MPLDRQRAFVRLFRGKTYDSVWNWLRRLGVPRRDRRDILQDVFLAGYQSFPTYDPLRARPERWLNRITVHVAAHYRDRAHHRREELSSGRAPRRIADERPNAEEQIDAEQTRSLILSRLGSLQTEEQRILIEHDIEGVPMATVAEQHGIPLSTAYKWRTRAIASLRAQIEEPRAGRKRPPRPAGSDAGQPPRRPAKAASEREPAPRPAKTAPPSPAAGRGPAARAARAAAASTKRPAVPRRTPPRSAPLDRRPDAEPAHAPASA